MGVKRRSRGDSFVCIFSNAFPLLVCVCVWVRGRWGGGYFINAKSPEEASWTPRGWTNLKSLTRPRRAPFTGSHFILHFVRPPQIKRQSSFHGCTNSKVSVSWWIQMLRARQSRGLWRCCRFVCECGGGRVNLKNEQWLPMMHNREGLGCTKQQTVWWSTKTCSSGAHWKMIAD